MTIEGKIIGFDRQSDMAGVELDLPSELLDRVRIIANVPASDPDLIGSYQLDNAQIRQIAETTHLAFDPKRFSYFLEGHEAAD
jgi:hypothetical protein